MDFDDHDNEDEEMGIPTYNPALSNSSRPKPGGAPDLSGGSFNRSAGSGVRYRECLKNHAVSIGGHAVDGCGEFTAAGEEGTIDALRCAACNCHRNFHRKDAESGGVGGGGDRSGFHSPYSPYYRMPMGYLQYNQMGMAPAAAGQHRLVSPLALPSTSGGGQSREEQEMGGGGAVGSGLGASSSSSGKKRFRTKFSQEQKNKMLAFAERVGWRIQKSDEAEVQQFCEETSIKRHVFKVWMHNNKLTFGKQAMGRSPPHPPSPAPSQSIDH